jgi:hypothetical protein
MNIRDMLETARINAEIEMHSDERTPNRILQGLNVREVLKPGSMYRGTVPSAVRADRRRKNKVARRARRAARK